MVSLARKNLLHDRLRFAITVAGVAFAVTLVLVQVGLFMGLLDKATVTIQHAERRHLGHLARDAQRGLRAHLPRDDGAARARRARRRARRQPDRRVHEHPAAHAAPRRAAWSTRWTTSAAWNLPWDVNEGGDVRDLRRGRYILMDRSAERRFGPFAVGDYREILGRRFKIIGTTSGAASFTTAPIVVHGLRQRAGAAARRCATAPATSWSRRRPAPTCRQVAAAIRHDGSLQRRLHRATSGRAARARTGWSRRAWA